MNPSNSKYDNLILSPLADPVIAAIFANAELAGLASESIANAVFNNVKEDELRGNVVNVTPQRIHSSPTERSCFVDLETITDADEYGRTEVQTTPDKNIMVRGLFSAAHKFVENSNKGDTSAELAAKMPRVFNINLLCYNLRTTNKDLVQPYKIVYTKKPIEVAIPHFRGYNIQLPRILEMKANFKDPLFCWCYALYTAHVEEKTLQEVISMSAALQRFEKRDAGFRQFCNRYGAVCADPEVRKQHALWYADKLRQQGVIEWAQDEIIDRYEPMLEEAERNLSLS